MQLKKLFTKEDKENSLLIGLVQLYIKTSDPIASNTLKENGFDHISSATIRNYFSNLEKKGYLHQQHVSGGRIPTSKAFKYYIEHILKTSFLDKKDLKKFDSLLTEDKKVLSLLNSSLDLLSNETNLSIFQSFPRFDQDFINNIKLVYLEKNKLMCIILTDLGVIKTDLLYSPKDLDESIVKQIEDFFLWRMNKKNKPNIEDTSILKISQQLYNEIMVRYIIGYSNEKDEIYKTGLSKLLQYPDFKDPVILAEALSIFENSCLMNQILQIACQKKTISYYICEDLEKFQIDVKNLTLITIPYFISNIAVGAIAVLAPINIDYKKTFSLLQTYSDLLSKQLTKMIYKHKITFRQSSDLKKILDNSILLEDQRNRSNNEYR